MRDATFFTKPEADWQRRYEALRASFVDRIPDQLVAERFGYSPGYINQLRHQFRHGKIDIYDPVGEGKTERRKVNTRIRQKIVEWRKKYLSGGEIAELLDQEGIEISVRTVERVLAEEGFKKLPRRTQLKLGRTVKGAEVPDRAESISLSMVEGKSMESDGAGIFLFAPFLAQFDFDEIIKSAGLPESKYISAKSYILSFLALKLLGTERYSHIGDEHSFDFGLGLFAGLNVLPKCTALSTYSYSLDQAHIKRLQEAFVKKASLMGIYKGDIINLDFHTIPHFGDESVLDEHWAGARGKRMKGALTLFAQDSESKLILYTAADIQRQEADSQVLEFLPFWQKISKGIPSTFVFDSRFTKYSNLEELNQQGVKFITLRRRGKKLLDEAEKLEPWKRITIHNEKRKFPNPLIHESMVMLRDYEGELRQIILRGNGHEKPAFLITNDFESPAEVLVNNYARRWHVETGISEAIKFFHLNALSSPILIKIHFDIVMTMIADTLYWRLAQNLRGFTNCDAPKIYRSFIKGQGIVEVKNGQIIVTYPKRAHNPILRSVPWGNLPNRIPWLGGAELTLKFK